MSPRPDVSKERTRQILDAAMKVFSRSGFEQASMDDIVEEAGLSKGALYWYFKSKDDLIVAILDSLFARELADIRALPAETGSARARLLKFTDITLSEIKNMLRVMPLTYQFYSLAFHNKAVQKALRLYFRGYMDGLVPLVQQGIEQGEFRTVDPIQTAVAIGALIEGTLLLWIFDPQMVKLEEQIQSDMQLLLAGLEKHQEASG